MSLRHKIALTMLNRLDPQTARTLLEQFDGEAAAIFEEQKLSSLPYVHPALLEEIKQPEAMRRAEEEMSFIEKHHIQVCWYEDDTYPERLRACPDAPLLLYVKGNANLNAAKIISVVGTRKMTVYGRCQTEHLMEDLSATIPDLVVVSGLAYGIDVCAHSAAMKNHLSTYGVLAHGLDMIYPSSHRKIAQEMLEHGALISEMPTHTAPLGWRFIQRNRVVAGLCDACVVVESAEKGGSLITAHLARDYNRDVFAMPGRSIDTYSRGCNKIIKSQVAAMIESADDLIREMNWDTVEKKNQLSLFPEMEPELHQIAILFEKGQSYSVSDLMNKYRKLYPDQKACSVGEMLSRLLQLEMSRVLVTLPGGRYGLF